MFPHFSIAVKCWRGRKKKHLDETIRDLTEHKTNFIVRRLNIGDFVWVARNRDNKELVLPYVVERKRMDDLADSIKGDRFREQKVCFSSEFEFTDFFDALFNISVFDLQFRLRQCGLPNVIYLIEKHGKNDMGFGLPANTLGQAAINTQLVDNFFVKNTNHHAHSMMYLSMLTKLLTDEFKVIIIVIKKNYYSKSTIWESLQSCFVE